MECHTRYADIGYIGQQEQACRNTHKHIKNIADVHYNGAKHIGIGVSSAAILIKRVVDAVKVGLACLLVTKDLDHLLTVHHLLNIALGGADSLLLTHKVFGRAAADSP